MQKNSQPTKVLNIRNSQGAIFSVGIVLLIIVIAASTLFMERRLEMSVNKSVAENAQQSIVTGKTVLISHIEQSKKDIKFLSGSSAVRQYNNLLAEINADPKRPENRLIDDKAVKQTFLSMMQQQTEIDQLRIISFPDGLELIRMERTSEGLRDASKALLQNKSSRDYFMQAAKISNNQVYVSNIDLNRENGEIQYPTKPTIRLALPLTVKDTINEKEQKVSILVININAQYMLNDVKYSVDPRFYPYLLNDQDGFLIHPNPEKAFAHEFNAFDNWHSSYGKLTKRNNQLEKAPMYESNTESFMYIKQAVELNNLEYKNDASPNVTVNLVITIPKTLTETLINEGRKTTFGLIAIFTAFVLVLLLFFKAYFKRSVMLSRAKSEYQAIVDGSADAIIGLTPNGVITTWNKTCETLFFTNQQNAINKPFNDIVQLLNINIDNQINLVQSSASNNNLVCECQYQGAYRKIDLELSISAINTQSDGVIGVSIICKDVTFQKQVKAQIEHVNQSLEQQVSERTKQLVLAKNEAEQANVIKSDFISNISHEMRTPLNGILGTLELITKEPLSNTQHSYLHMTETSINSLNVLINDILDLSKIEAGKMSLDKISFDLID